MTRLRQESHARMLGNGMCTRPVELECRMESACETCAYFRTGPEFVPVLLRQRDHARKNGQIDRAELFEDLVDQSHRGVGLTRITRITPDQGLLLRTLMSQAYTRAPMPNSKATMLIGTRPAELL